MKICFVLLALTLSAIAYSQPKSRNLDIRLSVDGGSYPFLQNGGRILSFDIFGGDVTERSFASEILYQTHNSKIQIGVTASYTNLKQYYTSFLDFGGGSNESHLSFKQNVFAVMPVFNYSYLRKSNARLYSEVCFGAAISNGNFYDLKKTAHTIDAAFQCTVLGIRFGNRIAGFTDVGYGYKGILQAGVSYSF